MIDIGTVEPVTLEQIHARRLAFAKKIAASAARSILSGSDPLPGNEQVAGVVSVALEQAIKRAEEDKARVAAEIAVQEREEYMESRRAVVIATIAGGTAPHPSVAEIQRIVSENFNVTVDDVLSSRCTPNVVLPRHVAMYLSKVLTARSLPDIGWRFSGRDHTTVLHAVRKIGAMIAADPQFRRRVELIQTDIIDRVLTAQRNAEVQ